MKHRNVLFLLPVLILTCAALLSPLSARASECVPVIRHMDPSKTDLLNEIAETKGGVLHVKSGQGLAQTLMLNNCPVPANEELASAEMFGFKYIMHLADRDVVVLELDSGGTGCPAFWTFLTIFPNGTTKLSKQLGNCSDAATVKQKGDSLTIKIPKAGANPPQVATYHDGKVSCDTCIVATTRKPVQIGNFSVSIRRKVGKLEQVYVGGKPTGIRKALIRFVGKPIALASGKMLLVQKEGLDSDCDSRFVFLEIKSNGDFSVSREFGNCTPYPHVHVSESGIQVRFPVVGKRLVQEVTYANGVLTVKGPTPKETFRKILVFHNMREVFLDVAKQNEEQSTYYNTNTSYSYLKSQARYFERFAQVARKPMFGNQVALIITTTEEMPDQFKTKGCASKTDCDYYVYVYKDHEYRRAGNFSGKILQMNFEHNPPALLLDNSAGETDRKECYVLLNPDPHYPPSFLVDDRTDNPCKTKSVLSEF